MAVRPRTTQLAPGAPWTDPQPPGFVEEFKANWRTAPQYQLFWAGIERMYESDPTFKPIDHLTGYEEFAGDIMNMRSREQVEAFKARMTQRRKDDETMAAGEWGLLAGIAAGIPDVTNLIPIPLFKGYGLVARAARTGAANAAISGASALAQQQIDPLMTPEEVLYQTGASAVLGGAFGAIASRGKGFQRSLERMDRMLSAEEQGRLRETLSIPKGVDAARLTEGVEGMDINYVARPIDPDEMGISPTERVVVAQEPIPYRKGPDGEHYFWRQDLMRWVPDIEAGDVKPSVVPDDIAEALGGPTLQQRKVLEINEVANKAEFKSGVWKEKYGPDAFRNADEYMTFKGLKAMFKDVMVRKADETSAAFDKRADDAALAEFNSSKADASVLVRTGLEPWLDKLNLSPVAKAIRMAVGDNYLTNLPLQIGGDYGWAIRQNALGYRTKPSVLVRTLRHNYRFKVFRDAVDEQWVKYVRGANQTGREVMGRNVDAALAAAERGWLGQIVRGKALDYTTFMDMVGKSVFRTGEFQVNGFNVPPEARAAAKAFTDLAKEYEREALQHGVFYNQQRMERHREFWRGVHLKRKDKLAHFLWDETQLLEPGTPINNPLKEGFTRWYFPKNDPSTGFRLRPSGDIEYVDIPLKSLPKEAVEEIGGGKVRLRVNAIQMKESWAKKSLPFERNKYGVTKEHTEPQARLGKNKLRPAIVAEGQIFVGDTHEDAVAEMIEIFGETGSEIAAGLRDDAFGYASYAPGLVDNEVALEAGGLLDSDVFQFSTIDELIEDRVSAMKSEEQQIHGLRLFARVEEAAQRMADIDDAIEWSANLSRHKFVDTKGQLANYFPRIFDKPYIAQHREAFTRLLTDYYQKTGSAETARARAQKTVHNILNGKSIEFDEHLGDPEGAMPKLPGLRHLMARKLDIPNDYVYVDDELGEITLADFFETNVLHVAERYTREMGAKIETAKMFGDSGMEMEMARVQDRMDDLGWDDDKQAEYLDHLRLTRDAVLGTLKDRDPWAWDNRAARTIGNLATMSMMGRGLLASMVEVVRPGMINGWDVQYRGIATRFLSDLDQIKQNKELSQMTGDLLDMVKDRFNARVAELGTERDLGRGGTGFERWLEDRIPGFFKINGMTPWTMLQKDLMAFTTQHRIMSETRAWAEGRLPLDRQRALSAIGIGEREALLLAQMPIEQKGRLILPATGNWTGTDGQRAMNYLLDGMTAEMRRGIVTPSLADKPIIMSGILTWNGKRVAETDLLRLPFQFMGYGMAANQKVLLSGLQGRDANFLSGALMMTIIGMGINYLKTPTNAWSNKEWSARWLDAWETGGVGGFFLGDLNTQIEHLTHNQVGIRPALGLAPKFGRTGVDSPIDIAGPGVAQFFDIYRAFNDPEFSSTARAQAIRRVIPYNNVLWWASLTRDSATWAGETFDLGGNR